MNVSRRTAWFFSHTVGFMRIIVTPWLFGPWLSLLLLCSCATENPMPSRLPAEVPINKEAGRGGWLIVTLRLESGRKLPFIVDTGASGTLFDKSLEPILGKSLGTSVGYGWLGKTTNNVYAAPKLYLGGALLIMTSSEISTADVNSLSSFLGRPIRGILGMDVLEHYCIQLDFTARKMRFLDSERTDKQNWGKAFPIVALNAEDARPALAENLLGVQGPHSLIDSGYNSDGWLMPEYFRQWTNGTVLGTNGEARWPNGRFGGEKYPFVSLEEKPFPSDAIALRFLARHLVTLDFPNHALYLKRTSIRPLADENTATVVSFLRDLKVNGRLPGWLKEDHDKPNGVKFDFDSNSATVEARKNGNSSTYHYTVTRDKEDGPWRLQKAWRTDQSGRTLEKYPVPCVLPP